MRQSHLIISNAAIIWVARILQLVPQLILVPYLLGTIGDIGYGIYTLVWSLTLSMDQLQKSLQSGVVKYSAGFLAQNRVDEVNKIVSSSFVYSMLLAILVCVGLLGTSTIYNDPSGQIAPVLVVVGIVLLFIIPLTPYIAVIQSRQYYFIGSIAETISKYISLIAVVAWFHVMGPSIEIMIIIMVSMLFFSKLAQVPIAYRVVSGLRNRPSLFNWRSFRLIASFGAAIVLASLCLAANSTGIRWLMNALVSPSFVAHLAIMLMPALLLSQIINPVTITIMPATSAFEATKNHRMLKELLIRGMRYTVVLGLSGLFAAVLLMNDVLNIWVGSDYVFLTSYALILFASMTFMLSTSTAHHMLKGMGKLRIVVFIYLSGLVIVPILCIVITFTILHNPYIAVTLGLAMGNLVCGFLQLFFCMRIVYANTREVFMRSYIQPLFVALTICPFVLSIIADNRFNGLMARICASIFIILVFLIGIYVFIATSEEKLQAKEILHRLLNKINDIMKISTGLQR